MALTVANASVVMTERVEPVLRTAFQIGSEEETPTFSLFMRGEKERTNELGRRIPFRVVPNASYGSITEGGQLPLAGTPEMVQARVYYLNQFMTGEINRSVLDQATESTLVKFLRTPMEDDMNTFLRIQNLWMHGTGSGALGVATAVTTGASGTVTFGGDYGAENFVKGQRLVFYSAAAAAHNQSGAVPVSTVTAVNMSTNVVTFDTVPTDVVATDTAHYFGSYGLAPHGISYHVSEATGTWLGLNTATYGGLLSSTISAGATGGTGGTALTPGMMDLLEAKRRRRSGANVGKKGRTYISHSTQEFNYRQLGYTSNFGIQRIIGANSKLDLGINGASHNGQAWVLDNQAPKSVIWDLYLPDWAIEYTKLPTFYDDGNGNKLWMKSGSGAPYDALQFANFARYDLVCKNRANQGALLDLPYPAGF